MTSTVYAASSTFAARRTQRFYVWMAVTFMAIAVLGFVPTYWLPMTRGTLAVPPIIHIHGVVFFAWIALYIVQTWLGATGNWSRHREVGVVGVSLATAMLIVGLATAATSMKLNDARGFDVAGRQFSIVSVTAILLFAVLVAIALVNVRNPGVHKRLMLVATASLLQAPIGRVFATLAGVRPGGPHRPPPVGVTIAPGLVADLLIAVAMIRDWRTQGRVHPAYWIAGGCVLAVQLLRVPLSTTHMWMGVTDWVVAILP
jgi:hypothetical protein